MLATPFTHTKGPSAALDADTLHAGLVGASMLRGAAPFPSHRTPHWGGGGYLPVCEVRRRGGASQEAWSTLLTYMSSYLRILDHCEQWGPC